MGGLLTVLGVQWTGIRSTLRRSNRGQRVKYALIALGALLFASSNFLIVLALVNLPRLIDYLSKVGVRLPSEVTSTNLFGLGSQLLSFFFIGALIFLLIDSISTSLPNIYQARDLPLLLSSPLSVRHVFFAKLTAGLGRPYLLLTILGLPYLLAIGIGFNASWPYYPLAVAALLLLPLLTSGIGVLITAVLVRWLPARRISEALAIIGGLIGIGIAGVIVITSVTASRGGNVQQEATRLITSVELTEAGPLPTGWIAYALRSAGRGNLGEGLLWGGLFAAFAIFCYVGGTLISANLFYDGWVNLGVGSGASRAELRRRSEGRRHYNASEILEQVYGEQVQVTHKRSAIQQSARVGAAVSTWRSVLRKDLRVLSREPAYIIQLLGPGLVTMLFILQARQSANLNSASPSTAGAAFFTVCLWVLFISSFASGLLGLSAFTREQKAIWMLKLSPLGFTRLVLAKFLLTYLILAAFGTSFSLLYSILVGAKWWQLLAFIGVVVVGGLGAASLCVGIGTSFGTLNSLSPQSINVLTAIGSLIGLLLYQVFLFAAVVISGTLLMQGVAIGLLGLVPTILYIAGATVLPLYIARRRLERLDI